ncbi:MAG: cation transporter, partial [Acidimicrobiales bacterium]
MTAAIADGPAPVVRSSELIIDGMTCASCATRIEKRLNRIEGVTAMVNYATERAKVTYPDTVDPEELTTQVAAAGYSAKLREDPVRSPASAGDPSRPGEPDPSLPLRRRLIISSILTAPVIVTAMVPATQFRDWQWLSLMLAFPVVTWGSWPFHQAA